MNRKFLIAVPALVACLFGPDAAAVNDIEPGKEFYTVIRTPNSIVLDGNLSEWSGIPVLADPKFSIPSIKPAPSLEITDASKAAATSEAISMPLPRKFN